MRTTLTIDDDVAALLARLRKGRHGGLKDLVNEALRRGFADMMAPGQQPEPYHTPTVDLGRSRLADIGNVAEALAIAEGENFR